MTEEQRVGQLFLLGVGGDRLTPGEIAAIEMYHIGSTWLVNWRTGGIEAMRPLTAEIQALATESNTHGIGFFVGADQEGGQIQRLTGQDSRRSRPPWSKADYRPRFCKRTRLSGAANSRWPG